MQAIRVHQFGGPDVLRLEEVPDPVPGKGQVAVAIKAVGVNPVDTYIRAGAYARKPSLPYTPGTDAAGVIEAVGESVTGLSVGQRVYLTAMVDESFTGAYAQKAVCGDFSVYPLLDPMSFVQGAAVGVVAATAYHALLNKGQGQAGETVLVHGASGGVGLAALQIARAHGFRVIGTAGTPRGCELVQAHGAHHVVDHTEAGYLDRIMAFTGGRGVDVVLEMLANVNLNHDLGLLAMGGRIVVIGSRGDVMVTPRLAMQREAKIVGMLMWSASHGELHSIHAGLAALMDAGALTPVVGRELPLSEAATAHEAVMTPGAYGKIVLVP